MSDFRDKVVLITGGTGSFGHTMVRHLLERDVGEIRISAGTRPSRRRCGFYSGTAGYGSSLATYATGEA